MIDTLRLKGVVIGIKDKLEAWKTVDKREWLKHTCSTLAVGMSNMRIGLKILTKFSNGV